MILYNVTVNVEHSVADEWLQWMKETHIPEVMGTGFFLRNQICRLVNEIDNGGTTYAVQYYCRSLVDLEEYQRDHAPELQEKHLKRYGERALAFRTVLEVVAEDVERNQQP
ncbi:MAG: DUF4286 family protein [Hymenobacteraceae bacterium]|nr:DUF4286 family protein [Hymenobacteraceae bacterium]